MRNITFFLSALLTLCLSVPVNALRITDSSTSDRGARSTYASLNKMNTVSTYGYQNSYGIPVGMIVAWSSQGGITTPDKGKWLECNGQTFDINKYPDLYEVLGVNRVPSLNGEFLRGTTVAHEVLSRKEDSIKSHEITVDPHTHELDGKETSGTISEGVAAGQSLVGGIAEGQEYVGVSNSGERPYIGFIQSTLYISNGKDASFSMGTTSDGSYNTGYTYFGNSNPTFNTTGIYKEYYNIMKEYYQKIGTSDWYGDESTGYAIKVNNNRIYLFKNAYKDGEWRIYDHLAVANMEIGGTNLYKQYYNNGTIVYRDYGTNYDYAGGMQRIFFDSGTPENLKMDDAPLSGNAQASPVTGKVTLAPTGNLTADELKGRYKGATETAPRHTYVRYFIRAIP